MIDGVHILNSIPHNIYSFGFSWVGLITGILFLISIKLLSYCINNDIVLGFMLSIIGIFVFGIWSLAAFSHANVVGCYYTYEVTIDEDVKFHDIENNYEIEKKNGELYTIKIIS